MTVILIIIGALKTILKYCDRRIGLLEIRRIFETNQTKILLR